jgi:hypothetical protein
MFNDFGILVGRYNSALPTLGDGCPQELQLDVNGRLIISGRYLEDSAHTSGDAGIFIMGVRNDNDASFTDTDGDYSPIAVDEFGRVKVLADLDVDFDFVHEEDAAHTSGDLGSFSLAIRIDDLSVDNSALLAGTNGDYQGFAVNPSGELYVKDTDVLAQLVTIDAVLDSIKVDTASIITELQDVNTELDNIKGDTATIVTNTGNIDTKLGNLTHLEDDAHVSGDAGIMAMGVQQTADAALADDGDYAPYQVDENGFLKVNVKSIELVPGTEEYQATDALAAGADGLILGIDENFTDVASISVGAGQTLNLYGWSWEADGNSVARIVSVDGANTVVYKNSLNSSAMPGRAEHFSEGGRIEIAGAAGKVVKVQVRKRNANCDDVNAFGSLHGRLV